MRGMAPLPCDSSSSESSAHVTRSRRPRRRWESAEGRSLRPLPRARRPLQSWSQWERVGEKNPLLSCRSSPPLFRGSHCVRERGRSRLRRCPPPTLSLPLLPRARQCSRSSWRRPPTPARRPPPRRTEREKRQRSTRWPTPTSSSRRSGTRWSTSTASRRCSSPRRVSSSWVRQALARERIRSTFESSVALLRSQWSSVTSSTHPRLRR
mmetsp:Transcript_1998/g.7232  ORF Transcript_1998/g.7232 Transcript_1998/m.7232 type:complete len:209 (+) Transcript_1998:275-901(+)